MTNEMKPDVPATKPDAKPKAIAIVPAHDGQIEITVRGFAPLMFNPAQASLLNRKRAEFHGWKARLGDAGAVSADTTTGKTSPQEKYDNIKALVDFYHAGGDDWSRKVGGSGGGKRKDGVDLGLLVRAMIALGHARDIDHASNRIDKYAEKKAITRDEAMKALWGAKDIAVEVARLRAEAKSAPLDAGEMLDELGDD